MAGFIDSSMTLTLDGITPTGPQSWVGGVDGKPLETGDGESMSGLVLDVATPAAASTGRASSVASKPP